MNDITLQKFVRFCGKALLLAGILILLWWLGLAIFFPLEGMETSYLNLVQDGDWLWVNIIGLTATMLLAVGFLGLYLKQAKETGLLGFIGFLLAFFGSLLFMCIQYIETVIWPIFTEHAQQLLEHEGAMFTDTVFTIFYLIMGYSLAMGFIVLGIATLRAKILSKWGALLMMIGGLVFCLVISVIIVRTVGIVLLAAGLVWLGWGIRKSNREL